MKDKGKLALNENVLQICSKRPFIMYDNEVVVTVPWCSKWLSFAAVLIFRVLLKCAEVLSATKFISSFRILRSCPLFMR